MTREERWRCAVDRYFAPAGMALADQEIAEAVRASAAVREGERERLAEAWDEGHKIGWSDAAKSYEEDCDFETANPYAPSLAAPEGTEQ